ncbi:hypothetical protein FH972_023266 [Carpinus fangiana]|uniref:NAD(P)-binding protein n=1 Tax=Carpinus fangiana TaxID=176857 RepID=A0A5N6KV14_9ROSI|nr:hypothetical protein FH972_023266 [Carpinus fangiana]
MSGRLHARVAVITGAASGLGRAIALTFAAEGARIVCADLRPDFAASWGGEAGATHEVLQRLHGPDSAIFVSCDVSDKVSVKGLVASTVQWAGRLDIMINNAGISAEGVHEQPLRVHETPLSTFDRTMAINVRGVFIGCKYALAQMMEQEPLPPNDRGDRTRGWIVNMASILGTVAIAAASSYTASKHAVIGLTKQVAVEYAKDRIHCNAMCPGFVETALTKRVLASEMLGPMLTAAHPWGTLGKPNDIAKAVLFLASDDASWVTGHSLLVDGGYTAQ